MWHCYGNNQSLKGQGFMLLLRSQGLLEGTQINVYTSKLIMLWAFTPWVPFNELILCLWLLFISSISSTFTVGLCLLAIQLVNTLTFLKREVGWPRPALVLYTNITRFTLTSTNINIMYDLYLNNICVLHIWQQMAFASLEVCFLIWYKRLCTNFVDSVLILLGCSFQG